MRLFCASLKQSVIFYFYNIFEMLILLVTSVIVTFLLIKN